MGNFKLFITSFDTIENDIAADLSVNNLKDFLSDEADHNLLVFADTESRRHARKLANNLGVDFEPYVSCLLIIEL